MFLSNMTGTQTNRMKRADNDKFLRRGVEEDEEHVDPGVHQRQAEADGAPHLQVRRQPRGDAERGRQGRGRP